MPSSDTKESDLFERVKNEVDPERVLGQLGLEYEERTDQFAVLCPFHTGDSDPSLLISKTPPIIFQCFGCGETGSIIDLVMHCEGLDVLEAAQEIAEWAGIDYHISQERREKLEKKRRKIDNFEKYVEACHLFLKTGKDHPDKKIGKVYERLIENRHLDESIIDKAKVGFGGIYEKNKRDPIYKILIEKYGLDHDEIDELNLFYEVNGEHRSKFLGYYTLPFTNRRGQPNYITGRLLESEGKHLIPEQFNFDDRPNWPPVYRQASKKSNDYLEFDQIYNERQAIEIIRDDQSADSLFIVEGQFDALALMHEGYPAIAYSGTSNKERYIEKTVDLLDMMDDTIDHIYICFDREDATQFFMEEKSGKKAIELAQSLSAEGYIARIIQLPADLTKGYNVGLDNTVRRDEIDPEELLQFGETFYTDEDEEVKITGLELFKEATRKAKTWMDYALDRIDEDMDIEERVDYIEEFLENLTEMDQILQAEYIEKLSEEADLSKRKIKEKLKSIQHSDEQHEQLMSNPQQIQQSIEKISDNSNLSKNQKYRQIAQLVIDRLQTYGTNEMVPNIFFYNRGHDRVFMLCDGDFVEINRNDKKFRAVLSDFAKGELNTESKRGRAVIEELQAHAINHGEPIDDISWSDMVMDTDEDGDIENVRIYFPLANENNELVMMGKGDEPTVVSNAANLDNAIVRSPKKMDPWSYNPDVDVEKTMKKVKETYWDQVALPPEDRIFLLSAMFSIPVLELLSTAAHLRVQGSSNSGKTEVGKIITTMLLGKDRAVNATDASLRKMLEDSPMVCIDDFERTHFKEDRMKIIRIAISRGEHDKMSKAHEDSIITQKFRALVMTNGIDRITGNANRNRTFVMQPKTKYRTEEYYPEMNRRKIREFRDDILSCMVKITHNHVIPSYLGKTEDDEESLFAKIKTNLDKHHSDHPLDRLFGMFSMVAIYAKEISKYFPSIEDAKDKPDKDWPDPGTRGYAQELLQSWIQKQDQLAWESLTNNSMILLLLDTLRAKFSSIQDQIELGYGKEEKFGQYSDPKEYMREHYNIEMYYSDLEDKIVIKGTLEELFQAITRIAKEANIAHNFREPGTLMERMINSKDILEKRNWYPIFPDGEGSKSETNVLIKKKFT